MLVKPSPKTSKMRLWYLCILFMCFWCITVLIEDSKRVKYVLAEDSTEGDDFQLACFSLKRLYWANETMIDLDELPSKISNFDLLDLLENSPAFRPELFEELILKPIRLRSYFVFKDSLCLVVRDRNHMSAFWKLFTTYYQFNRETYDHSKAYNIYETEHQLIVLDRRQLQKKCREHYSKVKCLNECIKGKQRLAKYLYNANESGLVLLYYEESETVKANERECINQCKSESCKLVYYIPRREDGSATVFEVHPIISTFEFYVQLLGLVGFFTNLSLCKLLSKLVEFSLLKEPKLRNHRPLLELAVPSVCLLICLALYVQMVLDHVHRTFQPLRKEITMNSFKIEKIDLIICAPVNNMLKNDFHRIYLAPSYLKGLNSFSELEKRTEVGLNHTLESIWISYQDRWTNINWTVKANETLFSHWLKIPYRCFRIEIDYPPGEAKYRELLSITKLVVKLKNRLSRIYLLPKGQSFSENSMFYVASYEFGKYVIERTELSDKCVNYRQKNGSEKKEVNGGEGRGEPEDCDSRDSCISLCINREFMNNFQSVSSVSRVIDKRHFTADEWSRLHPMNSNSTMYSEVKEKCREKYWNNDCTEVFYKNRNHVFYTSRRNHYLKSFDLYLDVVVRSRETPSVQKLFFNMINIQSLLLNLTALRVLGYIHRKLNYKRGKLLIHLLCTAGFLSHIYHVVSGTLQAELVHSQHFDLLDVVQMPETMFCFEIDLNKTEGMTGKLLQETTKSLTLESVFKQIAYLDNENNWIVVNASELRNSKLKPDVFFFINPLKCFVLRQEIWYSRKQFEFREEREVLRIDFNETIFETSRNGFFMSRIPNTLQLSKINGFVFDYQSAFTVSQEIYLVRFEDEFSFLINLFKFNWLKNPFSLFSGNDVDQYIASLARSFRAKYNATTLYLPLEEDAFDYTINDTLFEQFYTETEASYIDQTANTNYKRLFAINNLKDKRFTATTDQPNFAFTVIFFRKTVVVTSKHTFLGLVLNVLNCFILWFDVAIPNFPVYIKKFYNQLLFGVKQLKIVCLLVFFLVFRMLVCVKNLLVGFLRIFLNFLKIFKYK